MEADVLWKAASHLPTGLGKRRQTAAGVSHISHSGCYDYDSQETEEREGPSKDEQSKWRTTRHFGMI